MVYLYQRLSQLLSRRGATTNNIAQGVNVSYAITGSNRGIGFELVNQLSQDPQNLIFALVRNPDGAAKLRGLQSERKNIHIVKVDITSLKDLKDAVKYIGSVTGGKLDWLINNAGYIEPLRFFLSFPDYPADTMANDMRTTFETNVVGVTQTINIFLPLLRAGEHKKVISLSSGLGDDELTKACGLTVNGPYSIAKYALNLAVLKYALALKDEGFIFLSISPGAVDTSEGRPTSPEIQAAYQKTFDQYRTIYPHFKGPVTPEVSVTQMLEVFKQLKPEHSGNFCSQYGPTSRQWL